jgi:FAD/FMN-containing dehydrogenase
MNPLIQALHACLGEQQVLTQGDLTAYEQDWRKRFRGRALAVVRPGNAQEVAAVLRLCAQHGAAVVPQGGNTGLVGGSVPNASGTQVLLSLQRLNKVLSIDTANHTLVAQAGCTLQAVQEAARQADLLFPLSLASEGSCTLGGNLATNAGGTAVLRYGNARELCLGLEVVLADGRILQALSGLRKDNTGYDLRNLFIGSEGTLGVITAATMKLWPQPGARCTALVTCNTLDDCVALLALAQRHLGETLTGFEAMNRLSLALVAQHFGQLAQPLPPSEWTVLLETSHPRDQAQAQEEVEQVLAQALEAEIATDAVVAQTIAQGRALWHLRESIPLAQAQDGHNIKHDIAVPVSAIAPFVRETDALLMQAFPGARLVNFGHLGDGNLHYNVQGPVGQASGVFLQENEERAHRLVYDQVQRFGGSISAEHGIGSLKLEELERHKSPVALELMRSLKAALDPSNLLNPGRVLR